MREVLRVACVPAGHPYARHLLPLPEDPQDVVHLPDPPVPGQPPGRWWPPVVVDPGWVEAHAGSVDVVHVHFGIESLPPGRLEAFLAALGRAALPLVYTVHDLTNPQLVDQERHLRDLGLLVGAAHRLVTLTPGAAAAVEAGWGRTARVVGHPHVLPLDARPPAVRRDAGAPVTVGVQLRDLRPNVDGTGSVTVLTEAMALLHERGVPARAVVDLNDAVRDEPQAAAVTALVAASPDTVLRRHGRLDDDALHRSLAELDGCLLPYRSGTHSGWLELCWDLGVPVLAPRGTGFYADQHPGLLDFDPGDAAGLADRVEELAADLAADRAARPGRQRERRAARRAQRRSVARAHRGVYEAAVADAGR